MKRILFFLFSLCCALLLDAQIFRPENVPNPKNRCGSCFVSDVDCVLSDAAVSDLNSRISKLNMETGVEIAVVIVPDIEGDDEYDFAYRLFNLWKIGEEGKDNGLLLLYVRNIRAVKFETGLGLEGLLPDAFLDRVLNEVMFPLMRQGDIDQGISAGITAVIERLSSEEAREELLLYHENQKVNVVNFLTVYISVGLVLMALLFVILYFTTKNLKGENNIRYSKLYSLYVVALVMLFIFPLPMVFFYLYVVGLRRKFRRSPLVCTHCGGSMRLLSEKEEDQYLNFKQQAEERVKSIDYDVWKCNVCDNLKILPYEKIGSKYSVCPVCNAKTYTLVKNDILVPPTSLSVGKGVKMYVCKNCNHHDNVTYTIPMIVVATSSGSSGRGGFGGGFGGGMSGGGGAGGRF